MSVDLAASEGEQALKKGGTVNTFHKYGRHKSFQIFTVPGSSRYSGTNQISEHPSFLKGVFLDSTFLPHLKGMRSSP